MIKSILTAVIIAITFYLARTLWSASASTDPPVPVVVEELLRRPAAYDGKRVEIHGVVLGRASLFGLGAFRIAGPSGASIVVLGLANASPVGELTEVSGVFHLTATLGEFQASVVTAQ